MAGCGHRQTRAPALADHALASRIRGELDHVDALLESLLTLARTQQDRLTARLRSRSAPPRQPPSSGTGLGLAIVKAIAEAHGGSLSLHARADGGLRLVITLPLAAAAGDRA